MKNKVIIFTIIWTMIFILVATLLLLNAPMICWDGWDFTDNRPTGGCYRQYQISLILVTVPLLIWIIGLVVAWLKYKRKK